MLKKVCKRQLRSKLAITILSLALFLQILAIEEVPEAFSTARKITDSDYQQYSGALGESKQLILKCAPFHQDLSVFLYINIHDNVHPDNRGVVFTIPGLAQLYTKYQAADYYWLHMDIPIRPSS
jgi:hypothetical protein